MTITAAAKQLERSERGQMTCKLLLDLLKSDTVKFLDGGNSAAVAALVTAYMLGDGQDACSVIGALNQVIDRNRWVTVPNTPKP